MTNSSPLNPLPESLKYEVFLEVYGDIYEDSPWVARAVWTNVNAGKLNTLEAMQSAMRKVVDEESNTAHLALIRAHPELAGRAAIAGNLTEASTKEQAGAGLDQCSPEEFTDFQRLNAAYIAKFSFPFIIAVTGFTRTHILSAFKQRLANDYETEFTAALMEIHKIAAIRLTALTCPEPA